MNYGFAIDTRSCIGCHACSTACKSENGVALGVSRTWVKYTEEGQYPDVSRHFQVTRCNHCANPPCVTICPVTAMYQRDDGIVEFDSDLCIGCKGCMQACPYDSIHIDPDTNTAAKCHYCAHRVEVGREPACVVVCPTHAIISGDMEDPNSEISHVLAKNATTVRKPEKMTSPNLFYIDGAEVSLRPTATPPSDGMMYTDVVRDYAEQVIDRPMQQGPRVAEQMVQVAYNAHHKVPWHWPVPAYLVTKGIGAGLFLLMATGIVFDLFTVSHKELAIGGGIAIAMLALTTIFLIVDLERPERFFRILLRPQMKSWITRGAFILVTFTHVAGAWWALELATWLGWIEPTLIDQLRLPMAIITLPLGVATAIYTAFIFAQCEGRDLWQTPLLPAHLMVQALMIGSAAVLTFSAFFEPGLISAATSVFTVALVIDLFMILTGEFGMKHSTDTAAAAAHDITHGRYKNMFWGGAILLGHIVPFVLIMVGGSTLAVVASIAALIGLYQYEYAFVMAPQHVPNS